MLQLASIFAGAFVPIASAYAAGQLVIPRTSLPRSVRFTLGAALVSLLIFCLLLLDLGYVSAWLVLMAVLVVGAWRARAVNAAAPSAEWVPCAIIAAWGFVYLICALAPETQPDAAAYHLRLVADHVRSHSLGERISFYDVLPQPIEMLFAPAFAIGGHSAARLVHFAFLITAMFAVRDLGGWMAAAIFFTAPVAGIAGTSAYTDLALVCATTCGLYLLRRTEPSLVLLAGICAGFAYAVKPTFGIVGIAAFLFVAIRARRFRAPALFFLGGVLIAGPWLAHTWFLTGNPVAPFLTRFFPNIVTTPEVEHRLISLFSAFRPEFSWKKALPDYTLRGGNAGILGPAFALAPLVLLAFWKRSCRWVLAATAILALPVVANTGTRFLLPAAAPVAIALVTVLPAPAAAVLAILQAVAAAIPLDEWQLRAVPVRAALRLEPEHDYLMRALPGYEISLAANRLPEGARILVASAVPEAYIDRETLVYWQSRQGSEFTDLLMFALRSSGSPGRLISWRGQIGKVTVKAGSEFRLLDSNAPHKAWQKFMPGDTFTMPNAAKSDLLIWPDDQAQLLIEGNAGEGERNQAQIDIRRDVTQYIRRSGYGYIIMPAVNNAFAPITNDMRNHPQEWGVSEVANDGGLYLYRILQL